MTAPDPSIPNQLAPSPHRLTRGEILRHITVVFSGSAIAQGVTALSLLLVARQLGAEQYGQYAACYTLASLTSIAFHLGLDSWLLREGGRTPNKLGKLVGSVLSVRGIGGALWWISVVIFALGTNAISTHFQQRLPADILITSALVVWLDCLLAATLTSFRAALRNKTGSPIEAGVDTLWLGITIYLAMQGEQRAVIYLASRAVVLLLGLILSLIFLWRIMRIQSNVIVVKQILKEALPFASADLLAWSLARLDVLVITFTLGEFAVGTYSPAVSLVSALFMVPYAVYGVMLPVISSLYPSNIRQMRRTTQRMLVLLFGIGLALTTIVALGSPLIVTILGQSYSNSLVILRILSIILIFKCLSMGVAAVIVVIGKQSQRVGIQGIAVLFNFSLNLAVVYPFGIQAVAGVYVFTEVLLLAGYAWIAWRGIKNAQLAIPSLG